MNERIKELIKQATVPGYMLGESYVQSRLDEQKFAELIIRECLTICEDVAERNDPAIACYYEIKRTFRS